MAVDCSRIKTSFLFKMSQIGPDFGPFDFMKIFSGKSLFCPVNVFIKIVNFPLN